MKESHLYCVTSVMFKDGMVAVYPYPMSIKKEAIESIEKRFGLESHAILTMSNVLWNELEWEKMQEE